MAEMEQSKRDYEFFGIIKNSFVPLKFCLTIEDFQVDILNGYTSPEIELHGTKLKFILARKHRNYDHQQYDNIDIWSNSSIAVSGNVMVNEKKHAVLNIKLKPRENTRLTEYPCLSNVSVVKIVFDLKVYCLAKKEFLFTTKKRETKTDADCCRKNLQDNLQTLWQSQKLSDVRIQVGEESIPAHKIILSARSAVFSRMFQTPSVESTGDKVDVTDVSFAILKELIAFLYGLFPDMATLSEDDLIELYYASDKYQVLDLRDMCGETLVDRMTTVNVCRLIKLFDRHSDFESMSRVVDFCCMNMKDVVELDGWEAVVRENPKFCSLVMKKMAKILK